LLVKESGFRHLHAHAKSIGRFNDWLAGDGDVVVTTAPGVIRLFGQ
jgi:hypothetical protein